MTVSKLSPLDRFVAKLGSHSALSHEERRVLLRLPAQFAQVRRNHDVVPMGQRSQHAIVVVDGLIGRFEQTRAGHRQITAAYIGGEMAGVHAIVAPDSASPLQAMTASTLLKVPQAALREAARRYPAITVALWRESVAHSAVLAEWALNVGRRDARTRTAHLFCEMAWRHGAAGERPASSFGFPVTQEHLGDMLALTAVHVNRIIAKLRRDRLMEFYRGKVHVLAWDRLAEAGEFDPRYLKVGGPPDDMFTAACLETAAE